jgi:hypothetical protein
LFSCGPVADEALSLIDAPEILSSRVLQGGTSTVGS